VRLKTILIMGQIVVFLVFSASIRADATGAYGHVTTAPNPQGLFYFANPPSDCYQSGGNLVFEDSPESWSKDTWHPAQAPPATQTAILAREPISAGSQAFIDFYGQNDWTTVGPAQFYVDIVGGGNNILEFTPAWAMGSESDPISVGKAASTQFLTVLTSGSEMPPGAHLYTQLVPLGDLISGELWVTQITPPATIYVWASVTPNCQSLSCAQAVVPDKHARGIFPGVNIIVKPTPQDLTVRYLDLGQTTGSDCTGPLSGFDSTIVPQGVQVTNTGDYGSVYEVVSVFTPPQESTDWYIGPAVNTLPLALGNWAGYAYENNGQQQICAGAYPIPINQEALSDNTKAVFLGTYQFTTDFFYYQLAGGAFSPERLFMAPSTVQNQPSQCVTPS
jgi:hypothetical protein